MYTSYFGLEEKPFSIAPNPDYLFMSDRHREALNHLTYGLGDTGGFVLLTGEVGTGKTTISRRLMENLPDNTQAAFILNPTLSSQELLATLCDELKIRYRKTGATLKILTDKIQQKLLKNHSENVNTLLIIDEAQHLQPEVLEQLRLLTNLETNTKKLLQVILIGQPELQQLLQRRDLRQLAQRITARYHLLPLNKHEVDQYLKHRLSVAKCFRNIFDKSAVNAIHKTCKGIPRLMNLLAERALMNAYNSNNAVVNRKIVLQAAHDALGDEYQVVPWWQGSWVKYTSLATLLVLVSLAGVWWGTTKSIATGSLHDGLASEAKVTSTTNKIKTLQAELDEYRALVNQVVDERNQITASSSDEVANLVVDKVAIVNKNIDNSQSFENEPQNVINTAVKKPNSGIIAESVKEIVDSVKSKDFVVEAVDGVSDELLASFQSAIAETKQVDESAELAEDESKTSLVSLAKMPTWVQDGVASLQFEMHIYASDGQGWVRVNGRDRYEGDYIARELLLSEIRPQEVVLSFRGEKFTMLALSSWN